MSTDDSVLEPVCRECAAPWPSDGAAPAGRCLSCDCPFWVYR